MIEKIAKTINIDNSRSHRNGLLPFVPYGGGEIKEVNEYMPNGNYGGYVCDIAVFEKNVVENGVEIERARLKYLDIIRNYSFVQEQIRNGVFVKKYKIKDIDCNNDKYIKSEKVEIRWKDAFEELAHTPTYNFQPLDISLFTKEGDYYVYNEPHEYAELSVLDENELSVNEKIFVNKIEKHNDFANGEEEFAILIPNYDEVIKYNNWWKEWWGNNTDFFKNYENSEIAELQFYVDVDKYLLGRVEVVLTGDTKDNVPNYVFYTELKDRIAAEKEGEYFDFLKKITPIWQKNDAKKTWDKYTIKYIAPEVVLEAIINAEEETESLYIPYEYSINKETNKKEGVVNEYIVDEKYSRLTPDYFTFDEDTTIMVESQLQSLVHPKAQQVYRDIFGVYEEFAEGKGQMFKCTYKEGVSNPPHTVCYHSGKTINESGETISSTGKTYVGEKKEKCPKPSESDAYICYATKVKEEFVEVSKTKIKKNKNESGETYDCYWSATTTSTYRWWECTKCGGNGLECADGEMVSRDGSDNKYRNVTIVSCIDSLAGSSKTVGDTYYVLARFDNGRHSVKTICDGGTIVSLEIPYLPDVPLNIATYSKTRTKYKVILDDNVIGIYDTRIEAEQNLQEGCEIKEVEITTSGITYDVIDNVTPNENGYIEIEYIKGKLSGTTRDTGIRYRDTIKYKPNNFGIIPIDGVSPAELYYDTLDIDGSKKTIYSEEYNLKRRVLQSKIISMEVGSQWTEDGAVNALLFTKEGSDGIKEEPKYDINLLYNRGNAAAWENHFKLSECNTLEDLENYGNNFFNL